MKKKMVIMILIISGVILFSEKVHKINIIENINQNINKQDENISENVTVVDITDLESNITIEHEHIFKTMYDENIHWEECKICEEKTNIKAHQYISSWTMGSANNCSEENKNKFTCTCGYEYENTVGRKAHTIEYHISTGQYEGYNRCTVCNTKLGNRHKCRKNDGSEINCSNLGQCTICGYSFNYNNTHHYSNVIGLNKDVRCIICNTNIGVFTNYQFVKESANTYKLYTTMYLPYNSTFNETLFVSSTFGDAITVGNNLSIGTDASINNVVTITINKYSEIKGNVTIANNYYQNGKFHIMYINTPEFTWDTEKPTISSINTEKEWNKTKPIVISGTENYCNTVKVQILDENEKEIYTGTAIVTNGKYSISCTPEIEANEEGKTFTVIVTDNCGNSTQQEFTIAKIDSIPPTPTSETKVEENWAKSKNFTFKATDEGIGNVSIAFNDIKDLKLANYDGNEYSREYQFTGDVYSPKELSVLYKDELGNTKVQKITVDKLDNTAPSITNVNIHNNKLSVTANDTKEGLGEGSGVTKYRFITSSKKLENPEITGENSTEVLANENIIIPEVYKVKYIYIVAEDAVRKHK